MRPVPQFTFQYVSINTLHAGSRQWKDLYLHSNMFLLIRKTGNWQGQARSRFTFQYVSINTGTGETKRTKHTNLHSNMFLLILIPTKVGGGSTTFTFQYVSINTNTERLSKLFDALFTFQYVSINTMEQYGLTAQQANLHSNKFLLIQCQE